MDESAEDREVPICAIHMVMRGSQRYIGAAVRTRLRRKGMDDSINWRIELYDFSDNDHFSNLDCLIVQLGDCEVIVAGENLEDRTGKKLQNIFDDHNISVSTCKKSAFKVDSSDPFSKLGSAATHITNSAEIERPLGLLCLYCLCNQLDLLNTDDNFGRYEFGFGSLSKYMKMDSLGASAIHLLPKSDDPSPYGSLYGVLNRCKTKVGSRLLDRWVRQPLLDITEINQRLDMVELFKESVVSRNSLAEVALKGVPDVDTIIAKIQKPNANLGSVYKLYLFTKALPKIISALEDLATEHTSPHSQESDDNEILKRLVQVMCDKYLNPLLELDEKFDMYRQLVEHVIDFDQLPDFFIAPSHDEGLMDLQNERISLEKEANRLQDQANSSWGSFADVKLEHNSQHGFIFRTTRGDDERDLRANNPKIQVLSILKNGLHFTTPQLCSVSDRYQDVNRQYQKQQSELVKNAVATARTYLPIVETACAIVAQLDVLVSFATVAALSPSAYVRPTFSPLTSRTRVSPKEVSESSMEEAPQDSRDSERTYPMDRKIILRKARHPCVELMDGVDFIANDYDLLEASSNFQIITGPNMGGKSTYIRGLGCIVAMAQMGSFVPCEEAHVSIIDNILARVGAGDSGQKGISTFMAEMLETSVLLETATPNSLIIIDELGRGTSTSDGFGIAWAIAEYICTEINTFTLFASHFHELTAISKHMPNVVNKHVTALVQGKEVIMLHTIQDGPCLESFGIHVAAMAGFPDEVVNEAKRKAEELENSDPDDPVVAERSRKVQYAMERFLELPMEDLKNSDKLKEKLAQIIDIGI